MTKNATDSSCENHSAASGKSEFVKAMSLASEPFERIQKFKLNFMGL